MTAKPVRRGERVACPHCGTAARYIVRCPGTTYIKCPVCQRGLTVVWGEGKYAVRPYVIPNERVKVSTAIDAQEVARRELAEAMVPQPADLLGDVGPLAQVFYLEQLAYAVMQSYAAMLSGDEAAGVDDDSEPVRALAAVGEACGNLDAACILLAILPPEAAPPA